MKHVHSQQLERWLGAAEVERVSYAMRNFYYPVALHGVPGNVLAMPGGDFTGRTNVGREASAMDKAQDMLMRFRREQRASVAGHCVHTNVYLRDRVNRRLHAFASLSALIAARTGGKGCDFIFAKTGATVSAIGGTSDLWTASGMPTAGAAAGAAPGGTVPTNSTAGSLGFVNAVANANTSHFVSGAVAASVISNTLLLYDRIFSVAKTMNSSASEAVTGVPTRYSSQTNTAADYIGGNFMFCSNPATVLSATAHNWTPTLYTNQAGTTGQTASSVTGISGNLKGQTDMAVGQSSWFFPLASGDVGVKNITNIKCSAVVATGTIDFVIGHPIALMPCPVANMACVVDGINTAFNLVTIFDGACLAFLEMPKPATTGCVYSGQITTVSE
jgi:hypothetical protein